MTDGPTQHGDEHALFERYHDRLHRAIRASVNTSPEIVDDACAFAWMALITHQPRRETIFAWLRTVARHEALRLDRLARRQTPLEHESPGTGREPTARHATIDRIQEMLELRERLQQLPDRQREIVFLHAAGWRYRDLADQLGVSHTRINQLLARAGASMRELDIAEHEITSPRGQQLRAIEQQPPAFILAAIGPPPRSAPKTGTEELRREWRRLVLDILDYRTAADITDPARALGAVPTDPERDELRHRITTFRHARGLGRGIEL